VLDFGSDEGVDFIALEYVEGKTLKAILDEEGPLGVERALDVAHQVALCLADAHEKGIVHRDIRPANLMLTADRVVKVMDFGIAQSADLNRLTATGVLGSPHYLSPEQAEGKKADIRSDIYSLGVTLFEMLAVERPYEGESAAEVVRKHLQESVPSLQELDEGIPTEVDELVRKCLTKKPGERYQTPLQLLAAIGGVMRAIGLEEKPGVGIEDALAGQTLGQYRLIEKIGRGGMATVYKAYEPSLDRYVAVKVLSGYVALDPGFVARFEREAKAIAKLDHPNILPVYDYGREGDITYIAMKYAEAGTLREKLGQPLPLDTTVDFLSQVAGALDHAHRQGVIHRDVKPSNVLMSEEGWALLGDFGLAKMVGASVQLTGSGVGVGTPAYMSPEQGQGIGVDARSDVYSLGVMLYEMLTGRVPYEAETPMAVVLKHITAPLPLLREVNPALSEAVERVVLKAMAKDPADRYQSAGKLAEALEKAAAGVMVEEAVPVVVLEVREAEVKPVAVPLWRRVPLWGWGVVGGAVLLAVIVGGVLLAGRSPKTASTPAAVAARATSPAATVPPTVAPVLLTAYPTYTPFPTYTPVPTDTPVPMALPPTDTPTPSPAPVASVALGPCCEPLQPGKGMIWVENFIGGGPLALDVGLNYYEIPPPTWEDGGPGPPGCLCLQLDPGRYMAQSHQPGGSGRARQSFEFDIVAGQIWHWPIVIVQGVERKPIPPRLISE
jgi:serine/threonine protein kinase